MNKYNEYSEYINYRENLANSYYKLTHDKKLNVAYFGGSITGGEAPEYHCYRTLIHKWIEEKFPDAEVNMINAAIGGTGTTYAAYRVNTDVLAYDPDLIFVEFAGNDDVFWNGYKEFALTPEYLQEFYDNILKKIYKSHPNADVVILYVTKIGMSRQSKSIVAHEEIAKYYGLNSVYFGQAYLDFIATSDLELSAFTLDKIHPTPMGHDIMVKPLIEMFANVWDNLEVSEIKPKVLPEKPFCDVDRTDSYYIPIKDTDYDETWSEHATIIMRSNTPGGKITCKFTGDEVAVFAGISERAGIFDYRIDGGEWKEKPLYAANVRERILLADGLEYKEHTLEIKVSDKIKEDDIVAIYSVLVN